MAVEEKSLEAIKSVGEMYRSEIEGLDNLLIPLLRAYVDDIRAIRMTIHSEVKTILQTMATLREVTRDTPQVIELFKAVNSLAQVMTPEMEEKLKRLLRDG